MLETPGTMPDPKERIRNLKRRTVTGPTLRSFEEQKKKLNPPATGWITWWPVAAGVALAFLAPWLRAQLTPLEPWGMRIVFPFVLLAGRPELGLSDELTRTLPQLMLLLQFFLEGLLTKFSINRGIKIAKALIQLVFLHGVCLLVLWLISGAAQ
jgi:hypothetical protein